MPNWNNNGLVDTFNKYAGKLGSKNTSDVAIKKPYTTRIAPSPTGHAHIGTFRTALFNYLAARATGGRFILRIDDTDTARNDEAAVKPIKDALMWLSMTPDMEYRQSDRKELYEEACVNLVNVGLATVLHNGAIALKWHPEMPREWVDNISGKMTVSQTNIDQIDNKLILLKGKEGKFAPTYQLASTYDDYRLNINYIIRGTDHISNTPKQLAIWWALNKMYEQQGRYIHEYPEFAHIGLIFKDGKKLSKRDGSSSILEYRDKGYTPDAVTAFMLRLGWAPKLDNKENDLLSLHRAIEMFVTEGRMRNSSANMDIKKLDSYERKIRAGWSAEFTANYDHWLRQIKEPVAAFNYDELCIDEEPEQGPTNTHTRPMQAYLDNLDRTLALTRIKKPRRNVYLEALAEPAPGGLYAQAVWQPQPLYWEEPMIMPHRPIGQQLGGVPNAAQQQLNNAYANIDRHNQNAAMGRPVRIYPPNFPAGEEPQEAILEAPPLYNRER